MGPTSPPSHPLYNLVAATLSLPIEQVTDAIDRDSAGTWTSLKHLELAAAVEDAFGVMLTPREIRGVHTVGDLRELVDRREWSR